MAHTVVMPRLGNTVESCVVNAWRVEVGQSVQASTSLCEVETDKSSVEVPAGIEGVVLALLAAEGDEVPVLAPLAVVGEPGEEVDPTLLDQSASAEGTQDAGTPVVEPAPAAPIPAVPAATGQQTGNDTTVFSPRARALAASHGLPVSAVTAGSGPHGRVIARDVEAAVTAGPGLSRTAAVSPDVERYRPGTAGTGIGGRVLAADLVPAPVPGKPIPAEPVPGEWTDTPIRGIRKIIADRMVESLAVAAQLSYHAGAPADGLLALRARLKACDPELGLSAITIGDLVAFAAAKVAARHAVINAHVVDGVLRSFPTVHLGLAVDTPRGLMVPTVTDASALPLKAFSAATKDLAAQCQAGSIPPDLLTGATFTVSNLGSFGVEGFTPIVNLPQTSILGVGAIAPHAVRNPDGSLGLAHRLNLSLTADHRVVDGADAARYLRDLVAAITTIDVTILS